MNSDARQKCRNLVKPKMADEERAKMQARQINLLHRVRSKSPKARETEKKLLLWAGRVWTGNQGREWLGGEFGGLEKLSKCKRFGEISPKITVKRVPS